MSHNDVDMDLLRILGQLRNAHDGSTADGDAVDVGSLLEQAGERCPKGPVSGLFEALKRLTADGSRTDEKFGEDVVEALKVAEEILFAPCDEELGAKLTGLISSLAPEGADPPPTLDDAAALLVRMDPTDTEELVSLHGFVGSLIDSFRGLPDIRDQLNRAAEALDEVTGQEPPEKASREAAVTEVSGIIENVMKLAEDASFSAEPEKPPVEAEAPHEPVAEPRESESSAVETTPGLLPLDADHELIQDFIAEGSDYLDQAEVALLALEQSPRDEESINVVFRAFHTIKGVAGFLGLSSIAELAHHSESLLSRVRERELDFTEPVADITLRSADVLRELLQGAASSLDGADVEVPASLAGLLKILQSDDLDQRLQDGKVLELGGKDSDESVAEPDTSAPRSSAETSVRVKTGRLDQLVDLVGELVVAQSMIAEDRIVLEDRGDLHQKVSRADKILRELQDLSTSMRMVPLRPAFQKLNRVVRDVSRRIKKPIRFVTEGEDTELDRNMVDVIVDPLVHMVRNSIDHGIEPPDERRAAGKDPEGVVTLAAYHAGGSVIIEVSDDGRGLDRDRIVEKAIERGIIESDRGMFDQEIFQLIFAPGFSTAAEVTSVSGRGVGMDVVRKAVESLRGRVEIESKQGEGSRFAIHLPLTLAITDGLLIRVGSQRYILPMVKIHSSFQPRGSDMYTVAGRSELVRLHEQLLPVIRLHRLYGISDAETNPTEALLVIVGEGSRRSALMVDDILGQQQFVVKALSGQVAESPGIVGGAIMADGAVGLILDPEELIELARHNGSSGGGRSVA